MEFLIATALLLFATAAMALGAILRGRPLTTSCSTMACMPDEERCAVCPRRNEGGSGS